MGVRNYRHQIVISKAVRGYQICKVGSKQELFTELEQKGAETNNSKETAVRYCQIIRPNVLYSFCAKASNPISLHLRNAAKPVGLVKWS